MGLHSFADISKLVGRPLFFGFEGGAGFEGGSGVDFGGGGIGGGSGAGFEGVNTGVESGDDVGSGAVAEGSTSWLCSCFRGI